MRGFTTLASGETTGVVSTPETTWSKNVSTSTIRMDGETATLNNFITNVTDATRMNLFQSSAKYVSAQVTTATASFPNFTYDDSDYYADMDDLWSYYLAPIPAEWVIMTIYCVVFVMSILGNGLIILYVICRKRLQNTVNLFMLNLALADFLVTVICLPITFYVDFFEAWKFGNVLCQFVPYLQMTVTSVSTLTLGAIAINRWKVVCRPFQVAPTNRSRKMAITTMFVIWGFSFVTLCPLLLYTEVVQDFPNTPQLEYFTSCEEIWPDDVRKAVFHSYYVLVCYALPLLVLTATYIQVFRTLRKAKIPGNSVKSLSFSSNRSNGCTCGSSNKVNEPKMPLLPTATKEGAEAHPTNASMQVPKNICTSRRSYLREKKSNESGPEDAQQDKVKGNTHQREKGSRKISFTGNMRKGLSNLTTSKSSSCCRCSRAVALIQARRRSAMMQVALIIVFGICYAPIMIMGLLRQVFNAFQIVDRRNIYFVFAIAHLALFINSAVNPIIYNFFSVQFRKEFCKTFRCCFRSKMKRELSSVTLQSKLHNNGHSFKLNHQSLGKEDSLEIVMS